MTPKQSINTSNMPKAIGEIDQPRADRPGRNEEPREINFRHKILAAHHAAAGLRDPLAKNVQGNSPAKTNRA